MEIVLLQVEDLRRIIREERGYNQPHPQTTISEPFIISGDEVCKRFDITQPTLIRWRNKGKIPFMQIGSAIRYDLNKVIEALEVKSNKTGRQ